MYGSYIGFKEYALYDEYYQSSAAIYNLTRLCGYSGNMTW